MSNAVDLAVEATSEMLYWVTSDRQVGAVDLGLQSSSEVHRFMYEVPAGVAVFEDFLYITLSSNNSIARVNRLRREGEGHYQHGRLWLLCTDWGGKVRGTPAW